MQAEIRLITGDLDANGGIVSCIEEGYVQRRIAEQSYKTQQALERGDKVVVGVNRFTNDEPMPEVRGYQMNDGNRQRQLERLASVKATRDQSAVRNALGALANGAHRDDINLMPLLIHCAIVECTVGEMVKALKDVWGSFTQPTTF